MIKLQDLRARSGHAFLRIGPQHATTTRDVMTIEEAVERAAEATERAHIACARIDRTIFRQQNVDPTPKVWLVHHLTNEAFKALIESRQACTQAKLELLRGDNARHAQFVNITLQKAQLAAYLANEAEIHTVQIQQERVLHEPAGTSQI